MEGRIVVTVNGQDFVTGPASVTKRDRSVCQDTDLNISTGHSCPGVALLNNHRPLVSPTPGNEPPVRAATLHRVIALVLLITAVRALGADGTGCRINDAAVVANACEVWRSAAGNITFSQEKLGHAD